MADVGCGNGKYFAVRPDVAVLGSDRSAGLVDTAMRRVRNVQARREAAAADVLLADGLTLPYRAASADAVLCIAVLHHISSPERRLRFVRALLALLRPGGRAIVTVWSTEQENPQRTLCRWTAIAMPADAATEVGQGPRDHAPGSPGAGVELYGGAASPHDAACTSDTGAASAGSHVTHDSTRTPEPSESGGVASMRISPTPLNGDGQAANYFVPWHLPFHRAGLGTASSPAPAGRDPDDGAACERSTSAHAAASTPGGGAAQQPPAAVGEVDEEKRTVVYKRYYHLFGEGELEALVARVPGARLCYAKYDASNWVVVFERCAEGADV